jgi:hypothetical protein
MHIVGTSAKSELCHGEGECSGCAAEAAAKQHHGCIASQGLRQRTDQLDKYAETGNADDTCSSGYAPGAFTGTWHDPVTSAYFNDNYGWDYVSNQFHWQRSRQLTW